MLSVNENIMSNMTLSPIILFVYNRPWHTEQTLTALSKNHLVEQSVLYIYADGPKPDAAEEQSEKIKQVRELIKSRQWCKEVHIAESDVNKGLADSIISGVTEIVNQYGKVIVLEDDIVTSPYFLKFMNDALNYYENEEKVWHISGWNYPIDSNGLEDVFLWHTMNCSGGWATWKDRWQFFEKNVDKLLSTFSKKDIYRLNINGSESGMWNQVLANKAETINTWAIFWYTAIFKKKGLCINPTTSFTENIGFDGTGIHSGETSVFTNNFLAKKSIDFSDTLVKENKLALKKIIRFHKRQKRSFLFRAINKFVRIMKHISK
jgi:hypothetical protein